MRAKDAQTTAPRGFGAVLQGRIASFRIHSLSTNVTAERSERRVLVARAPIFEGRFAGADGKIRLFIWN